MRDSAVLKGVGASEGLSLFCNGCKGGEVRCNGRGKPAPLRKARGIVRFWKGWCGNPSGRRPNFFVRQHLTFDKGGKFSAGRGIVRM